jgi:hypothetical protein
MTGNEQGRRYSNGHIRFDDKYEYFMAAGAIYRAPITQPVHSAGYRSGAVCVVYAASMPVEEE